MELEEPKPLVEINSNDNKSFEIQLVPNMGQNLLATGPRYTEDMLKIVAADQLGYHASGVLRKNTNMQCNLGEIYLYEICSLVLGVNRGVRLALRLRNGAPIQTFHVTGKFGKQTETNFQGDRITNRAGYKHVTKGKLQALLSSMQAVYQKQMFDTCGLDIQSQAAYELACKGLIRPQNTKNTVIYGMRNVGYTDKSFTIEVQTMNATEDILANLVVQIAIQLRTVAHCTKIRCTRYGYFSFEDSLLRSHWNLQNVLRSMHECQRIWHEHPSMVSEEVSTPVGYEQDFSQT